jgi:hypothetical protein
MRTNVTTRYLLAFTSLFFVLHELHEQAHTSVGRLLCGCWGIRGFNVWELCEACSTSWAPAAALVAGPLFSYSLAWRGFYWLGEDSIRRKALGFSLVFGTVMQARLLTAVMGGGDEVSLLRLLTHQHGLGRWLGLAATTLLALPPLWRAFQQLHRSNRWLLFLSFALLPLITEFILVFKGLDGLLKRGIGAGSGVLGMPMIVTVWTGLMLVGALATYSWLSTLFVEESTEHEKYVDRGQFMNKQT